MKIEETLTQLLITALEPTKLLVENESSKHAGHAGHVEAGGGSETHFNVIIVSEAFEGATKVARHRKVNSLAQPLFEKGLHALALKTYSPTEWALRGE